MTDYNDGKWHGWNGGECPVHPESVVDLMEWGCPEISNIKVKYITCWNFDGAFRVTKAHREPREFWISNNDGFAHDSLESVLSDPLTEKHGYTHVREVLA